MNENKILTTDIAILGAGIGGYETFRTLAKLLKKYRINKTITIIDRNNYFTFTPMLHEVASGSLEPAHCTLSLRELVEDTPHRFMKATVKSVNPETKTIETDQGIIQYETVVVALGSGVNFFNTPGAEEHTFQARTLTTAMRLRHSLIQRLESGQTDLAITVVGGGYTGIETASQLLHLATHDLKKLYPEQRITIRVVEAGAAILATLPPAVQKKVTERLISQGLTFLLQKRVQAITATSVDLADGESVQSDMTIWCAGVKNNAEAFLPATYVTNGRLTVDQHLRHPSDKSLYVVGDMAAFHNPGSTELAPQLGETAHREGHYVAEHVVATLRGRTLAPFYFRSFGMLIPIGDWYGVAVFGNHFFFGRIAWLIRRTVYLFFMPGIARKLNILTDWTLHSFGFRYIIDLE